MEWRDRSLWARKLRPQVPRCEFKGFDISKAGISGRVNTILLYYVLWKLDLFNNFQLVSHLSRKMVYRGCPAWWGIGNPTGAAGGRSGKGAAASRGERRNGAQCWVSLPLSSPCSASSCWSPQRSQTAPRKGRTAWLLWGDKKSP